MVNFPFCQINQQTQTEGSYARLLPLFLSMRWLLVLLQQKANSIF